jgi:hypothetical protein
MNLMITIFDQHYCLTIIFDSRFPLQKKLQLIPIQYPLLLGSCINLSSFNVIIAFIRACIQLSYKK